MYNRLFNTNLVKIRVPDRDDNLVFLRNNIEIAILINVKIIYIKVTQSYVGNMPFVIAENNIAKSVLRNCLIFSK